MWILHNFRNNEIYKYVNKWEFMENHENQWECCNTRTNMFFLSLFFSKGPYVMLYFRRNEQ